MGKKYIIEIEDGKEGIILCQKGIVTVGLHLENESELKPLGIQSAIPYTEPDLEQVRKEAYDRGYDDAKGGYENGFENGMIVAWDAARKICCSVTAGGLNYNTLDAVFGSRYPEHIVDTFTASEAIERLKQYEEREEELEIQGYFKNGEEVIDADGTKAVILRVSEDNYCQVYTEKGCIENWHIHTYKFHKTGRYFPEIAEVLKKMRGENND